MLPRRLPRRGSRNTMVEAWSAAKVTVVQVGVLPGRLLDVPAAVRDTDIVVGEDAVLDGIIPAQRQPADAFGPAA